MTTIGVILIIIGILSFQTGISQVSDVFLGIAFIAVGLWTAAKAPSSSASRRGSKDVNSDSAPLHADREHAVEHDDNGEYRPL